MSFSFKATQKRTIEKAKVRKDVESDSEDEELRKSPVREYFGDLESAPERDEEIVIKLAHSEANVSDSNIDSGGPLLRRGNVLTSDSRSSHPDALDVKSLSYKKIPISSFGKAMLAGMGWKEGDPVGKSRKAVVSSSEAKIRPSLLGLGAKLPDLPDLKKANNIRKMKRDAMRKNNLEIQRTHSKSSSRR